jgi:hypothetical protein
MVLRVVNRCRACGVNEVFIVSFLKNVIDFIVNKLQASAKSRGFALLYYPSVLVGILNTQLVVFWYV